jgi:hypothetical protein
MSRQERRREQRIAAKAARKQLRRGTLSLREIGDSSIDVERIFLLKDCVPLSDDVIHDLESSGWPREKLTEFRSNDGHYCSPRNSVIFRDPQGLEVTLDNGELTDHMHRLVGSNPIEGSSR